MPTTKATDPAPIVAHVPACAAAWVAWAPAWVAAWVASAPAWGRGLHGLRLLKLGYSLRQVA